jgi:DMSO/TMAO reductase YedYZ heme-binding membrane subunit
MNEKLAWYIARGSGLVAWALLAAAVLWGLLLASGMVPKKPKRAWWLDLHRFLGGTAVAFTFVHVAALIADNYATFGPAEILVPLASEWRPWPVAAGVVTLYLLVAVEVTSLLLPRVPHRIWRKTHYLSFALFALATWHLVGAGSDAAGWPVRLVVLSTCAAVVFLTLMRVLTPKKPRAAAAPAARAAASPPARDGAPSRPVSSRDTGPLRDKAPVA